MKKRLALLLMAIGMLYLNAYAQDFVNLTTEELKKMMDKKTKMLIVDARGELEFKEGHLPNAINIPPEKVHTIEKFLPKDKKALIVFYCWGWG
jgi:rhodanese-related sulfurtransferase